VKIFNWNNEKKLRHKENRGICFEDIIFYIDHGCFVIEIQNVQLKKTFLIKR